MVGCAAAAVCIVGGCADRAGQDVVLHARVKQLNERVYTDEGTATYTNTIKNEQ